jgi:hypothetical protein
MTRMNTDKQPRNRGAKADAVLYCPMVCFSLVVFYPCSSVFIRGSSSSCLCAACRWLLSVDAGVIVRLWAGDQRDPEARAS